MKMKAEIIYKYKSILIETQCMWNVKTVGKPVVTGSLSNQHTPRLFSHRYWRLCVWVFWGPVSPTEAAHRTRLTRSSTGEWTQKSQEFTL